FGRRTDGFPEKMVRGAERDYAGHIARGGRPYSPFKGSVMPPPAAVKAGKVKPLTDEDPRTLVRWVDLGCPIHLDHDPRRPARRGRGWMLDDQRPPLPLTYPRPGANEPLTRLVVGMHDYGTGLDADSFRVVADFPLAGVEAGKDLSAKFKPKGDGVWELALPGPLGGLARGELTGSGKERAGERGRDGAAL